MLGPDAARYVLAGQGHRVARPFNLRFLLPSLCRDSPTRWKVAWLVSWPLGFAAATVWALGAGAAPAAAVAAAVLLIALPGVWGPLVVRPVGVDLPAMAVGLVAAAMWVHGWYVPALIVVAVAASIKESSPVWVALWVWSPWPLVALVVPAVVAIVRRPEIDPVTTVPVLREVHDHPFRSALAARRGRWRDAWLMVAPWGVTLAGLVNPTPRVVAALAVAHAQLLIATDTVRLVHTAAGPVMALAAAQVIPPGWLLLAAAVHVFWWRTPEVV